MLNWLEIDLRVIGDNVREIKKTIGRKVDLIAVVKANAYGCGLVPVSQKVLGAGAKTLAVFGLEEGLKLRKAGIKAPVLILSYVEKEELKKALQNNITITLHDIETAGEISKLGGGKVHLKIDTGMHRLGILPNKAADFIRKIRKFKNLKIEGIFSHFSEAGNRAYSLEQLKRFKEVLKIIAKAGFEPPLLHLANSLATFTLPQSHFKAVRCGIALYKNALSFKAKIIHVKTLPAGAYVGYQRTYQTKKPTRIAVIAVGYADGYDRRLSNTGEVLIRGLRCPVIGRVCMNQTIINISKLSEIKIGETVTLIGRDDNDKITVAEIAEKLGTNEHEVISRLPENIRRIYYG